MAIKNLTNNRGISEILANIPQGDVLVLNIDDILVRNPVMWRGQAK